MLKIIKIVNIDKSVEWHEELNEFGEFEVFGHVMADVVVDNKMDRRPLDFPQEVLDVMVKHLDFNIEPISIIVDEP
jgi:hypothetical protein